MTALVVGCDFSSAPTRRKPVVVARAVAAGGVLRLHGFERFATLDAWSDWLAQPGPWVGGFDLPFGLPREVVVQLGWPTAWQPWLAHYRALPRSTIREAFAAFCAARPVGAKFAHRACDGPAGSSPSMKWVNPPVAFMLHAGVPRLVDAGVHLVGVDAPHGGSDRTALEAYPGLLARQLIGRRSYKADDAARQTAERLIARKDLVEALCGTGVDLAGTRLRLRATHGQRDALAADAQGDTLDAVLCAMQAAWAAGRRAAGDAHWGLPHDRDPLEGWIAGA